MARFIGFLRGSRGEVSRLGTPNSGITATAQGWRIGGEVRMAALGSDDKAAKDEVTIYVNHGSTGGHSDMPVATIWKDVNGVMHIRTYSVPDAVYEL